MKILLLSGKMECLIKELWIYLRWYIINGFRRRLHENDSTGYTRKPYNADNGTVVLTVDDAALLVTVPFTAASGKYAFDGAREAVDGLTDLTAGVVGTAKTLGTWIDSTAKSAWDNIFQSNNNDKLKGKPGEIKRNGKQETKIGHDGRAIKERHNTDHGNPKVHTNPHDHDITWDEEGNPVYSDPINYPDDAPPFE